MEEPAADARPASPVGCPKRWRDSPFEKAAPAVEEKKSHIITSPKLAKIQETEAAREKEKAEAPKGKLKLKRVEGDDRRGGKITVTQALSNVEDQRVRSLASMRRQREKALKKEARRRWRGRR